ncbi:hypothetical protein D3C76_1157760 [compost metagenome]
MLGEAVEPQGAVVALGQLCLQAAQAQQQVGASLLEHVAQAFGRVAWVQRQVGAAGLEDAEDADDRVEAAAHEQAHGLPRRQAGVAQLVRQLVGPRLQCLVAQLRITVAHGNGLWPGGDLLFEQLVQQRRGLLPHLGAVQRREPVLVRGTDARGLAQCALAGGAGLQGEGEELVE